MITLTPHTAPRVSTLLLLVAACVVPLPSQAAQNKGEKPPAATADAPTSPNLREDEPPSATREAWDEASMELESTKEAEEEEDWEDVPLDEELLSLLKTSIDVWMVTKTRQPLEEAPAIVTVIQAEQIRRWGYGSMKELLENQVGFYLVDDHIIPNAGVRGIGGSPFGESSNIKVMVDGNAVAFRTTTGNWLGPELIPMSAVERVEIIRGPGSALYGADAFLAVVNVVTRSGEGLSGGIVQAGGINANDNFYGARAEVTFGSRHGDLEFTFSGSVDQENRSGLRLPNTSPAPNIPSYIERRRARDMDLLSGSGLAKLTYHLSRDTRIHLTGYGSMLDRVAEFSPWGQLTRGFDEQGRPSLTRVSLAHGFVGLRLESALSNDLSFSFDSKFFGGGPRDGDRVEVGSNVLYARRDFGYRGFEGNSEVIWNARPDVTAVMGAGVIVDREDLLSVLPVLKIDSSGQRAGTVLDGAATRQGHQNLINPGVWLHGIWKAVDQYLTLTAGLRYDWHTVFKSQLSGRVGAVSNPFEDLYIKVLYGSAFKAPPPLLLYTIPLEPGDVVGNRQLDAQFVHTVEGQVSYKPLRWLTVSSDLTYSLLTDKAEFTTQGVNQVARNVADVGSLSWETEIEAKYREWLEGYFRAEWIRTKRDQGRREFQQRLVGTANVIYPNYILRAGVSSAIPKTPLTAMVSSRLIGERRASDNNIIQNGGSYTLGEVLLIDAGLTATWENYAPEKNAELSLVGRNLSNETGPDPGFFGVDYPLRPRTFLLQLRVEL